MLKMNAFKQVTERLIRQHGQINEAIDSVTSAINKGNIAGKADILSSGIINLGARIISHLGAEDKFLYPKMISDERPDVNKSASRYMAEMGDMSELFKNYYKTYSSPMAIKNNPSDFQKQTESIMSALRKRIEKEENVLFPLLLQ